MSEHSTSSSSAGRPGPRLSPSPAGMTPAEFLARFGGIYEHSAWVAEGALARGIGSSHDQPEALAALMAAVVDAAGPERQMALLRAHPELAGRLAVAGALTADSLSEQASARLDQCTPEEFARFTDLNTRYGQRFGFPFIIAVRGLDRAAILAAFEARIGNDSTTEFAAALAQVHRIARLRLVALSSPV
jgi:2-oxo-4-hydroxy-4-carboxy-5-ureidoimidazoline decarboxylase